MLLAPEKKKALDSSDSFGAHLAAMKADSRSLSVPAIK